MAVTSVAEPLPILHFASRRCETDAPRFETYILNQRFTKFSPGDCIQIPSCFVAACDIHIGCTFAASVSSLSGRKHVGNPLKLAAAGGGIMLAAAAALWAPGIGLIAADHLDPPQRTDPSVDSTPDRAADIADFYAWHTDDAVNFIVTFSGPVATDQSATYDPDVLYTINVSNAAPRTTPNSQIFVRFGRGSTTNEFGVRVTGIPGSAGPIEGSVETMLNRNGISVMAGLFDDPFFFDLQGFRETADTGTLRFNANRDFFAGQNLTAVVMSIPRDRFENGTNPIDAWVTTSRFGGQI